MSAGAPLRRLINYLRRFSETDLVSLAKEKDLLISLSQLLREIQCWIDVIGVDSGADLAFEKESVACPEEHLSNIVEDFVGLLSIESPYVQHLAGNVLVKISEFLAESGIHWDTYIHLLCKQTELAVIDVLSSPASSSATGLEDSGLSSTKTVQNAKWSMVACTFRVLCNILKYLRRNDEVDLLVGFFQIFSYTLANIPWGLLDEICSCQSDDAADKCQVHGLAHGNITEHEPRILFLGNFLQFLCSLVQQNNSLGDFNSSETGNPIIPTILDLVPSLLKWCLPKQESSGNTCISRYLRHKILVLMIRLTYHSELESNTLVSWLQLLHIYFQELLQQQLLKHDFTLDDCLNGSPFLSCFRDGKKVETTSVPNHLQRLTVFLFLRCSLSLIYSAKYTDCLGRIKGLQNLSTWIQGQCPSYLLSTHEVDMEKSVEFSTCFIQLYMHEDDLLFKILLQLLSVPLRGGEWIDKEQLSFQDEEQANLLQLSIYFNPVYLFHVFLSELQYDHQVLLDYLISKDIGISCAEYLLRCLRIVCESWDQFVKFPSGHGVLDMTYSKKRRILPHGSDVENVVSSSSTFVSLGTQSENSDSPRPTFFHDTKKCLLSLKRSIANLHRKNLFPYNPDVLLKRLTRFQELCFSQQQDHCSTQEKKEVIKI